MDKRLVIFGVFIFLISLLFGLKIAITGNVISGEGFASSASFIFPLFLFLSCFMIIMGISSKDSLQSRLGEMEVESPSSEESRSVKSGFFKGLKDKAHFMTRKVNQVPQSSSDPSVNYSNWKERKAYQNDSSVFGSEKLITQRKRVKEDAAYAEKEYLGHRATIYSNLSKLKKTPSVDEEISKVYREAEMIAQEGDLDYTMRKLQENKKVLMGEDGGSVSRYGDLVRKRRDAFYAPAKKKAEEELGSRVSGGKGRITTEGMEYDMSRKLYFSDKDKPSSERIKKETTAYIKNNSDRIPYISLSEIEKQGVTLVSGITGFLEDSRLNGEQKRRLKINNPDSFREVGHLSIDELASKLIAERPPLSASSVTSATSGDKLFSPWGVIIGGDGKVYDASHKDLATINYGSNGIRLAQFDSNPNQLHERVQSAISISKRYDGQQHDEFSVGGNYSIKGIYFNENDIVMTPERVADVVNFSREKGLPVYSFNDGKFSEYVEPKKAIRKKSGMRKAA